MIKQQASEKDQKKSGDVLASDKPANISPEFYLWKTKCFVLNGSLCIQMKGISRKQAS